MIDCRNPITKPFKNATFFPARDTAHGTLARLQDGQVRWLGGTYATITTGVHTTATSKTPYVRKPSSGSGLPPLLNPVTASYRMPHAPLCTTSLHSYLMLPPSTSSTKCSIR